MTLSFGEYRAAVRIRVLVGQQTCAGGDVAFGPARHAIVWDRCDRGGTGTDQDSDLDQAYCHGTGSCRRSHALGDSEAVDGAALGNKKARLAGRAFCFIGTLDQATMALLSKGHVSDFQRVHFAAMLRERPR